MKLQVPFLQLPLAFDAERLAAEVLAIEESAWRAHPQGFPGNSALPLISTDGDPDNDAYRGAMRPTDYLDRLPYLKQALSSIGATWGRSRLMRLSGHAEVIPHVDMIYYWRERVRVHVPILTQPTVRFHCGDAEINMAAGECWIFDTWRMHRVINDAVHPRIHLVADTVGGAGFWTNVYGGKPHDRDIPDWAARRIAPSDEPVAALDFETVNYPVVMSPWEMREHIGFLLAEAEPHPQVAAAHRVLLELSRRWHALWSSYGESPDGALRYRALLDTATASLRAEAVNIALKNGSSFYKAVSLNVLEPALAERYAQPETV
jgi:Aspartyl/Asparaginyl beta-hydroxylase